MKKHLLFATAFLFASGPTANAHASDNYDPTAIHQRGSQRIIGTLKVTGNLSAGSIHSSGAITTDNDVTARNITADALISKSINAQDGDISARYVSADRIDADTANIAGDMAVGTCCPEGRICVRGDANDNLGLIKVIMQSTGFGTADAKRLLEGGQKGIFDCGIEFISAAYEGQCNPAYIIKNAKTYSAICPSQTALFVAHDAIAANVPVTFQHPIKLPVVHYGLTIQFEYSTGSSPCDDADVAQFKQDVESWLASVNPDAPMLIAIDGCNSFSFISSFSNENIPDGMPRPPADGLVATHVIQDYYARNGDGSYEYMCASDDNGIIALTDDPRGHAMIVCHGHGTSGIYRRYAPSMTIEF